jgi:hypothetical protein
VIRELQGSVRSYKESDRTIPPDVTHEYEQRIKRLQTELEASDEQRKNANRDLMTLQTKLRELEFSRKGNQEVLSQEVIII